MKFTLSWLKDHLETDASLNVISDTLTAIGLEVEAINDPAEKLKHFIAAEIRAASPHPNASKLQVCRVWDGSEERQIVCGAANARAGLKVVLARGGVFIPGSGITIKKTKIRDVESNGMLCSAEELQLAEKSEGILELPASATPGTPAAGALGADPVFEIAITPNRADCLGVHGIARDLAAAGLGTLKAPLPTPLPLAGEGSAEGAGEGPSFVTLSTPACPLFVGIHLKGIKNGPSPAWLQERLKAIGLHPISALVDITNYFTFAHARPLHVFDAQKIRGGITVRSARAGERLKALDGKEYELAEGMTVIADESGALALGGIIGGEASGVTEATTEIFLESALFDPVNIARTGRALEIHSDARYRFERGVDPAFTHPGALLAARMIHELCGGGISAPVIAGAPPAWQRRIDFPPQRVKTLGGTEISAPEIRGILEKLGFVILSEAKDPVQTAPDPSAAPPDDKWTVTPPSWRADVEDSAGLVEEVLRIHGYQHIPSTPLPRAPGIPASPLNPQQKRLALARRVLAARGALEICSWSFISHAQAAAFGGGNEALRLANPISPELDTMRPGLLPGLLIAARNNQNRGLADTALFEVGLQFETTAPDGQKNAAALLRTGQAENHAYPDARFSRSLRAADAFDAKADALALLAQLGINTANLAVTRDAPPWYHPGRSGTLSLGKKITLGWFGEIHPALAATFDLKGPAAACEILLDALPAPRAKGKARPPFSASAFPAVARDFAFVVDESVPAAQILDALAQAEKALIREVRLFDIYSGKGVAEGKKSVAVNVTLQATDHTLTEAEINAAAQAVITAAQGFGGALRS